MILLPFFWILYCCDFATFSFLNTILLYCCDFATFSFLNIILLYCCDYLDIIYFSEKVAKFRYDFGFRYGYDFSDMIWI